jgi:hypothetical protein
MSDAQPSSLSFFRHRQPFAIASTLLASLILCRGDGEAGGRRCETSECGLHPPSRLAGQGMAPEGIPKRFVYDRSGKMVAQSIDVRTRTQFLEMLAQAGLL